MRRSGWLVGAAALGLWVAAVGLPLIGIISALAAGGVFAPDVVGHDRWELFYRSAGWAFLVALGAVVLGWIPGRVLGRLTGRTRVPVAAAMLVPLCLPAYLIFYVWRMAWPAKSWLYRWALEHQQEALLRDATLCVGLVAWSWPVVAWCVSALGDTDRGGDDLLTLDRPRWWQRLHVRLAGDGRGLALGAVLVWFFIFNHTTSFDIAQVYTFGFELRTFDSLQEPAGAILRFAWPALLTTVAGTWLLWRMLGGFRPPPVSRRGLSLTSEQVLTAATWLLFAAAPLVILVSAMGQGVPSGSYLTLFGDAVWHTTVLAVATAVTAGLVAVGLAAFWQDPRPRVRMLGHIQATGWLAMALVPGTITALGFEGAYNHAILADVIYTKPVILLLANLARYAFIGVLVGRWLQAREPAALRDLRALDDARDLVGLWQSSWPRLLAAGVTAGALAALLSISDLSVSTTRLAPLGWRVIATDLLAAVHYQRPQEAVTGVVVLISLGGLAFLGALTLAIVWRGLRKLGVSGLAMAFVLCAAGCSPTDADTPAPLRPHTVFGSTGLSLGQFSYPRGIAVDATRGVLYVVDKTARVQRFGLDGQPQLSWRMPKFDKGKPTGLNVAPDGRIFVADTHEHRVLVFDREGNELFRFGHYGEEPGGFIYPSDVAFAADGRIFVSEFGGTERIQVFDSEGSYLYGFGSLGEGIDQFNRPQSMSFSPDGRELFVADACNHRVVVYDPGGTPLRVLGEVGRAPGQFAFPYDVTVLSDGTLLVCEYGNNRVQHLTSYGQSLHRWGRPGAGEGELRHPWGVDATDESVYVLDSGNNRVQMIRTP